MFFAVCYVVTGVFAQAPAPSVEPAAVEKIALEARRTIRSIHAILVLDQELTRKGQPVQRSVRKYEIWMDQEHYRADIIKEGEIKPRSDLGRRAIYCKNCERPGHFVQWVEGLTGVDVVRADSKKAREGFSEAYDPRLLGYVMSPMSSLTGQGGGAYNLETELSSPALSARTLESAEHEGKRALVLRSKYLKTGADRAVWVLPEKGNSIGLIESSLKTNDGVTHGSRLRSDLARDAKSGAWFPKSCVLEWTENGVVTLREVVSVQSVEINQPIDPRTFTLAGIGVPDGTPVLTPESPVIPLEFRNGGIGPRIENLNPSEVPAPIPVNPSAVSGGFRWWYAVAAGLFVAVGVVLLRRAISRRPVVG